MSATLNKRPDGVYELMIDRDDKRNALNSETIAQLTEHADSIKDDADMRVVVLGSVGTRAFSAGADINELAALNETTAYQFINNLRGAIQAIADLPVPVICRIQGACIGGAMELAAACDIRIAASTATFCMPEVRVGIPSVIQAAILPRLMGRGRAGWLVLSGDVIDASLAYEWGFVEEVASAEGLDQAVENACNSILASAPLAVRAQKKLNRAWDELSLDDAINESMDTFAASYKTAEPKTYTDKIMSKKKR